MCYLPKDERWQDGVTQALSEKLGIHESMQREGLHISEAAHHSEEYRGMPGYPWANNHFTTKLCTPKSHYKSLFQQICDVHRLCRC